MIENLIKGGAFDSVEGNKRQLLEILDQCLEQGNEIRRSKNSAQMSLLICRGNWTDFALCAYSAAGYA